MKYLAILLIFVAILSACQSNKPAASDEITTSQQPTASIPSTPATLANEIQAGFKEIAPARVIAQSTLPTTYKELANHPIGQKGQIVFYENTGDMVRYAYKAGKAFYPIGDIGEGHYYADISILETRIFGKSLVRIKGVCGANCMMTDYLQIDSSGVSSLMFFGGDAAHIDLDQDGGLEILSRLSGTIPTIKIVKMLGQQLMETNVNEVLNTEKGVLYDNEKKLFTLGVDDQIRGYRLDPSGMFVLEPTP
ncbi:hypothetical protein EHS13_02440 [Paenibacillus psychroresistens]|uniref:Uncharacterized protein n=1 Tax=Paenibacillus psychroresistens TaxID=1778678 RepID=A0A6B8RDN0_9BACL|nr:hypothetical protein [Paenibacillus psychroresistens]QGQ93844.1 hypothetical protein EHS13_02440 [Paenibacillus psychroresistens]